MHRQRRSASWRGRRWREGIVGGVSGGFGYGGEEAFDAR